MKGNSNFSFEETTHKNTVILGFATLSWVLSMALATFGPKFLWVSDTWTVLGVLLNVACGILMIWANARFVKALDDLQKLIQLAAMGFALGAAVVFGLAYSLLDDITNLVAFDADISHLVILISLTYITVLAIGQLRYR